MVTLLFLLLASRETQTKFIPFNFGGEIELPDKPKTKIAARAK